MDNSNSEKPTTWKEQWAHIRTISGNVPRSFKIIWEADRASTIGMAIVTLLSAILPAAQAWVGKLIVDTVVHALEAGIAPTAGLQAALPYLLIEFVMLTLSSILTQWRRLLEHVLHARLGHTINTRIMQKAITLDLSYFEDSEFYDMLQNARRRADVSALTIINTGFLILQNIITLASFATILLFFNPLIALLLFGATIPAFIAQTKYSKLYFRLLTWRAPEFRRMLYLELLLTVDDTAKEIKLFGLGEPLIQRHNNLFWSVFHEDERLARRRTIISAVWNVLSTSAYYGAYAWIVWITVQGTITLGDMIMYLTVFRQSQGTFQGLFYNLGQIYESGLFMDNLFSFLALEPKIQTGGRAMPVPQPLRHGLEFRDVSFRYPDQEHWTLHHVNLHIQPGETIALVGSNGAGKTTLIKLLTRLYEPTEGAILLDGHDLRDYDLNDLRLHIGVIFQDFMHYQTTARENIGFGQIDELDDTIRLDSASERGGANEIIDELPDGYETMLGRWFDDGRELSGGQWQKIALSRAFMRDGQILVLDEPTSALDAEREYEIFQRFRELTQSKTALLISHRFSTVRMADRIVVLKDGSVAEAGTHQELLAQEGEYAHLFQLQAEGYR